jgi:hypothetical protein
MPVNIDDAQFHALHAAFLKKMAEEGNGIPFTSFRHPALMDREIDYKWTVRHNARAALQLTKWQSWRSTPGKIIEAVKAACDSKISQGFLHHRHGMENSSESPLYRVDSDDEKRHLEDHLIALYESSSELDAFGKRFDELAEFTRHNSLGCKWPFFAYLAFVLRPDKCFPILPSQFDALLAFYGTNEAISGKSLSQNGFDVYNSLGRKSLRQHKGGRHGCQQTPYRQKLANAGRVMGAA